MLIINSLHIFQAKTQAALKRHNIGMIVLNNDTVMVNGSQNQLNVSKNIYSGKFAGEPKKRNFII